ncbi:MAG: hypothetical protein WCL11_11125 [Verrucomicrobiota bacterium]
MKPTLATWLSALCAALLIVSLILQTKQRSQLETLRQEHQAFVSATQQQHQYTRDVASKLAEQVSVLGAKLESRLAQNEQLAKDKAGEILNIVQQNTAVMHRALGKAVPVMLPDSLTNRLAALETQIQNEESWPKDRAESATMAQELRSMMTSIPPWAEDDLLPRLNALRWAVQSFQVIQANADANGGALETAAEAYANQLSIQPDTGSTNLATKLALRQKDAAAAFEAFRRETTISDAKQQLALPVTSDGVAVWQRLSEWTNDPTCGQQATQLRQQLHSRLVEDEVARFSDATKAGIEKLGTVTNDALRQAGYLRTLETVTTQRLRLLEETDTMPSAVTALADLSALAESRIKTESEMQKQADEKRIRDYQQWALRQVSAFRKAFDKAMQRTKPGAVYGTNPDPDFRGVANAMIVYLIPISPAHLDLAVAMIYRQAFDEGTSKLSASYQTDVAEKDAVTPKKTPQNYSE